MPLFHRNQVRICLGYAVQGIRGELAALRSYLAAIRVQGITLDTTTRQQLGASLQRLNKLGDDLESTQARLADLADNPELLIDYAITTSVDTVTDSLLTVRGCAPAT